MPVKREVPSLMRKEDVFQSLPRQQYVVAVTGERPNDVKPKIPVATTTAPQQRCGKAQRIGSTRTHGRIFPLYRIRIIVQDRRTHITLPSLFVLVNGVFVDYEHWCNIQEHTLSSEERKL